MSSVTATQNGSSIVRIKNQYWEVVHDAKRGGCPTSIKFVNGTRKNLLAAPLSWRVRNLDPRPTSDASSPYFYEAQFEKSAQLSVEHLPSGDVAVTASGLLRLENGQDLGISYRQRFEYREWGLVACELELNCPEGRNDIVEVVACDMILREGMTDAYVREHPIRATSSDLIGMGKWHKLNNPDPVHGVAHAARYVPLHVVCYEKGVEGIEFTCCSDLALWDSQFTPDSGLGYYSLGPSWGNPRQTQLQLAPYCVAYRRNPIRVKGTYRLRYYLGLPFIKKHEELGARWLHAGTDSHWASNAQLESAAKCGVKLLRFHNDYREDGPFWHDGTYPPYDENGMAELRRIVEAAHNNGMRIVPYISVKEFHPQSPGWKENREKWRQQPGPSFPEVHTWFGSGEFGQVMCLESGWLDFRKKSIESILNDLPWDGLYFDWCTPHACRNPRHFGGNYHTDQDAFYDFMFWARKRVGAEGVVLSHISGLPQVIVENMSTALLIFEDQNYSAPFPEPGCFPAQVEFIPIAPRHLCATPPHGTADARRTTMSGILQGTPPITTVIGGDSQDTVVQKASVYTHEFFRDAALFSGEDLASYSFLPAQAGRIQTGQDKVYAALWYKKDRALLYLGNYSPKPAKGALRLDLKLLGARAPREVLVSQVLKPGKTSPPKDKAASLKGKGMPYSLRPCGTALYKIEVKHSH